MMQEKLWNEEAHMPKKITFVLVFILLITLTCPVFAVDTDITRRTLSGLPGISVAVEDFQPNIKKHVQKAGLTKELLQQDIETRLQKSGITVLSWNDMLKTKSRAVLYVNINTHEYERYFYAYDTKIELQQLVAMEADPRIKSLAVTWSTSMTGAVHLGNLNLLSQSLNTLLDKFIEAYREVNVQKPMR
jgi:hypothetical protein